MKLFTVKSKGKKQGFIFHESTRVFPKVRARITAYILFEFAPAALEHWNLLSEQEQEKLICTVASKELTVEDLKVEILET